MDDHSPPPPPIPAPRVNVHTRSQPSTSSVQSLRYEDIKEGLPPRNMIQHSPSPETLNTPPRSFPSFFSRRAHVDTTSSLLSEDIKRDSGIAPSVSTVDTSSPTTTTTSSSNLQSYPHPKRLAAAGAAREPSLPTIVVDQHDESLALLEDREGTTPPVRTETKAPVRHVPYAPAHRLHKMSSFRGIDTVIPTTTDDDLDFGVLSSDQITFSQRGSLLFGGRGMQDLIAAQAPDAKKQMSAPTSPVLPHEMDTYPSKSSGRKNWSQPDLNGQPVKQGLQSGRRTPSMQMLRAAINGGRVLSAEEISFSRKVRSMYAHGDERAADWVSIDGLLSAKKTPEFYRKNSSSPDVSKPDVQAVRTRQSSRTSESSSNNRLSYYAREENELAGGIEDWGDIDSRDVDRYGFIHQGRAASRAVSRASNAPSGLKDVNMMGMQRVATSLRLETDHGRRGHRRLSRGPASMRSSRSMPPKSREGPSRARRPGSIHSTRSTASRAPSVFRAKSRRVLAEASDMLTLPPHLAAIQEDEDTGKNASALKQREWKREEKWQKMARPVRHRADGKGGGMRFEFDTTDPKLIERTWKGIPDRWRATAWHSFLTTSARNRNSRATDEELIGQFHKLQEMNSADDVQIDVDVPRTVNMHIMFRRRYRGGQRLLFRVLHAISLYFPDIGYVQGMASLAATLLCYFDEEKAFVMLVRMWQLRGMEQLFQDGFAGLMACFKQFEDEWLEDGDIAHKLRDLCIASTAYATRWYLTLFNMSIPFQAQLRVWDVFMLLGDGIGGAFGGADLDVLHATSAALIDAAREILLDSDFENAMKVLTSFVPIKDEDVLMRVARAEYKMKKKRVVSRPSTAEQSVAPAET